jgi:hypothetical protein
MKHSFVPGEGGPEDAAVKGAYNRTKSLQELEQDDWGDQNYDSHLVTTVHRLRRKPLAEFTVEDLRIMIGQRVGLPFLIPLAMERLEEEPLAAGDLYAGDLLGAVLRVGDKFWVSHPDFLQRVRKIVARVKDLLPSLDETNRLTLLEVLAEAPQSLTE